MSQYTESDIDFQNRRGVLRCAPWLDMPALRKACKESLLVKMTTANWRACRYEFLEDVKEFCEDKRGLIPRVPRCLRLLDAVIYNEFPVSRFDSNLGRSRDNIRMHLMQLDNWHMGRRGVEE